MDTKHLLVTGGTGFIGQVLINEALEKNIHCTVLTRDVKHAHTLLSANVTLVESLQDISASQPIDWVINLAGESLVSHRWNEKTKAKFIESRLKVTQALIDWMASRKSSPEVLVNSSAIGWYGDMGDEALHEKSLYHDEFIHELCDKWEAVAKQAEDAGVCVCYMRTGLVLGHGGAMKNILPAYKLGLGGALGSGEQWWSWIHIQDLVRLYLFSAENKISGVVNGTAPHPVRQKHFAKVLGKVLHRPSVIKTPSVVLKLVLGEFAEALLLHGQQVLPCVAQQKGFTFDYPELEQALQEVVSEPVLEKAS